MKTIVCALLALVLGACSTIKSAISPPDHRNIGNLTVVSALGDSLQGVQVGTIVFGNTNYTHAVPDWKVDEFASQYGASVLVDAGFKASALALSGLDEIDNDSPWTFTSSLIKPVSVAALQQGYDTVLLIHNASSSNFSDYPAGYGLYQRRFFNRVQQCVYAMYIVSIIDTKTQRETGWEWGGSSPCDSDLSEQFSSTSQFADYTPEQQQSIKVQLQARLKSGIDDAISKLGLLKP